MEEQPGEVGLFQNKASNPKNKKHHHAVETAISALIISLFFIFSVLSVLLIK